MRLTVPEPKIKLYEQGFEDREEDGKELDKLNRKPTGDKLSELVERIDDPLVIALDGAWGSGKSFFLKCWVGEHKNHNAETKTVYFDAFQHDFLDDPLIALTAAISERIEQEPESKAAKAWRMAKNAAPFLGKAALRLGTAALVGKAVSLTGDEDGSVNDIGDKMAEEGGEISKSLVDFWKKEDGKRQAMDTFRTGLIGLTQSITADQVKADDTLKEGTPTRKLVIVIDELDRCRPDYALSLLEIIKHFFNVDGVHFVLGVNLTELQNSVKARYGSRVDAETYLQKFIAISLRLTTGEPPLSDIAAWQNHLHYCKQVMGFPDHANKLLDDVEVYLKALNIDRELSLRDVERVLTLLAVIPGLNTGSSEFVKKEIAALVVLKALQPETYLRLKASPPPKNSAEIFHFSRLKELERDRFIFVWKFLSDPSTLNAEEIQKVRPMFGEALLGEDGRNIHWICGEYIDTIDVRYL